MDIGIQPEAKIEEAKRRASPFRILVSLSRLEWRQANQVTH
jgi:hypothetical protein